MTRTMLLFGVAVFVVVGVESLVPRVAVEVLTCSTCRKEASQFNPAPVFQEFAEADGDETKIEINFCGTDSIIGTKIIPLTQSCCGPSARLMIGQEPQLCDEYMSDKEQSRRTFDDLHDAAACERVWAAAMKLQEELEFGAGLRASSQITSPTSPVGTPAPELSSLATSSQPGPREPCFTDTSTLECLSDHICVKKHASTLRETLKREEHPEGIPDSYIEL